MALQHLSLQSSSQVANVLRGSESLVVSEDGKSVRRKDALGSPEEISAAVDGRSLFAVRPSLSCCGLNTEAWAEPQKGVCFLVK